jgi:hypothetical protein
LNALAKDGKPIVDIRFNADYSQVANSHGDEWAPTWAKDDCLYTGNDDGNSFGGFQDRSIAFGKMTGDTPQSLVGATISDMGAFGNIGLASDQANWKTMNSYCVDDAIYMFVTRCFYPEMAHDPIHRHIFKNSSIIKSTDQGKTWTRSEAECFKQPMFPGLRFGAPYFVWYGRDGAASVDNAGKYVYAVANNGHFEDGDDYILGRVLKKKLPDLNATDWQFYAGGDGMSSRNWKSDITKSHPILQNATNCSMTGMTYISALKRYVMVVWHYTTYDLRADPRTIDIFYEAPKPWGPWTPFKTIDSGKLGWYVPIISQKFQTPKGPGKVDCILFATGNYQNRELYKVNYIPITLSTEPLSPAAAK